MTSYPAKLRWQSPYRGFNRTFQLTLRKALANARQRKFSEKNQDEKLTKEVEIALWMDGILQGFPQL